ncbi:hypothetical protein ABVT39_010637 [Epinephelus coioides]
MLLNYRRERNLYIQQSSIHKPLTLPLFNMLSLQYCVFSLLFLYILTGVSCEELTPVKNEEYSLEDSTVTLSYRYSKQATAGDYFFWYRQYPGKPPEFLVSHLDSGDVLASPVSGLSVTVSVSCEELTPVKNEEYSLEGSTVTLSYRYSKQAAGDDYFFWYRQYPGKPPEFIIFISGMNFSRIAESLKSDTRFFTELTEEKRRVDLQISSAAVTDSAVYYCAVRPTVTGNTKTLYKNMWIH